MNKCSLLILTDMFPLYFKVKDSHMHVHVFTSDLIDKHAAEICHWWLLPLRYLSVYIRFRQTLTVMQIRHEDLSTKRSTSSIKAVGFECIYLTSKTTT